MCLSVRAMCVRAHMHAMGAIARRPVVCLKKDKKKGAAPPPFYRVFRLFFDRGRALQSALCLFSFFRSVFFFFLPCVGGPLGGLSGLALFFFCSWLYDRRLRQSRKRKRANNVGLRDAGGHRRCDRNPTQSLFYSSLQQKNLRSLTYTAQPKKEQPAHWAQSRVSSFHRRPFGRRPRTAHDRSHK